jgi:antirestriction protein ArdC
LWLLHPERDRGLLRGSAARAYALDGASHRLAREFGLRFGDHAYAFEELVAELGAAFLCAAFGITNEPRPDHAMYVASWLKVLNNDARAIFTAANRAQEAIQFLGEVVAAKLIPELAEETAMCDREESDPEIPAGP